ncbi:unnamed protein product [Meganyctiphanes norvegica]|uniref:EF-hand domain-containing protein n=1 Tax=Meganyctiphanes norvegica TaxID=48144 RepID=A0AAV2REX9_MEGNR
MSHSILHARLLLIFLISIVALPLCHGSFSGSSDQKKKHLHEHQKHKHHQVQRPVGPGAVRPDLLKDGNLLADAEHIAEELPKYLTQEQIKGMSRYELEYHYFKIHDFDENKQLDGLEILSAISHIHDDDEDDDAHDAMMNLPPQERRVLMAHRKAKRDEDFQYYIDLIDNMFDGSDRNKDGLLSYPEYVRVRRTSQDIPNFPDWQRE